MSSPPSPPFNSMPSVSTCSPPISLHHQDHFTCSAHRASTAWSTSLLSFSCLAFGTSKIHLRLKFWFGSFATFDKSVFLMVDEKYEEIYDHMFTDCSSISTARRPVLWFASCSWYFLTQSKNVMDTFSRLWHFHIFFPFIFVACLFNL